MIVSTLSQYPGKVVKEDLGVVYAWDNSLEFGRHIYNSDESYQRALEQLIKKAEKLNANAILGMNFSFSADSSIIILMGTAVILE